MNTTYSYIVPVILAVSLHAGTVAILFLNWEQGQVIPTAKIEPYYIEARVVRENPHRVRQEKEQKLKIAQQNRTKREQQARVSRARIDKQRLEQQLKQAAEQNTKPILQETMPIEPPLDVQQSELERLAAEQEEERLLMEQSLIVAISNEQKYRRAVTDDEKAMAYVSQIQREIINNWSRPPSARNGMRVLLRVFLVPTGEVVNVALEETSGNDAFDRSAVLAVRKAERFVVPPDSRQFEKNFREFEVLFRPDDLRL